MSGQIIQASKNDYDRLSLIWESAVKATHEFLDDKDFVFYQSRIKDYFGLVELYMYKEDSGEPVGFMGVSGSMLEMLFVDAAFQGSGIGTKLLRYAVTHLNVCKLDVNEQNSQAVRFYMYLGFEVVGRSSLDNEGKPYPLLHLHYNRGTCDFPKDRLEL